MDETAIEINDLHVRVHHRTLLTMARWSVRRGEFLGLLGSNGAGKTTLLRCCLGMQRYASGHIRVLGEPLECLGIRHLSRLRQRIGYVPQLLPVRSEIPLTVREVVAIGRSGAAGLFRRLNRRDESIIDEWVERLGLAPLARQGYGEISGGEQRKTLIARAMVQQPEILLLDEPTANLDLGWRERIVQIVEKLYRTLGLTVVLVCHELEVLPPACERVTVLQDGKLVADGSTACVITNDLLKMLYGPGLSVLHVNDRYAVVPGGMDHA